MRYRKAKKEVGINQESVSFNCPCLFWVAGRNPDFITLQKDTEINSSSATNNQHSCCNLSISIFVKGLNCQNATCLCLVMSQKAVFVKKLTIDVSYIVHCYNIYIGHFFS